MKISSSLKIHAMLLTLLCALLAAIGQLLFKLSTPKLTLNILTWLNPLLITGLASYGIAVVVFTLILRKAELSILYPIIATSYIWVAFFSLYFLNESLSIFNWAGMFTIVIGVSLTSIK